MISQRSIQIDTAIVALECVPRVTVKGIFIVKPTHVFGFWIAAREDTEGQRPVLSARKVLGALLKKLDWLSLQRYENEARYNSYLSLPSYLPECVAQYSGDTQDGKPVTQN